MKLKLEKNNCTIDIILGQKTEPLKCYFAMALLKKTNRAVNYSLDFQTVFLEERTKSPNVISFLFYNTLIICITFFIKCLIINIMLNSIGKIKGDATLL